MKKSDGQGEEGSRKQSSWCIFAPNDCMVSGNLPSPVSLSVLLCDMKVLNHKS